MTDAVPDDIPTLDTSAEGLDAFADHLAVVESLTPADRDRVRAKLAELEGVVFHPKLGRLVRMVEHEIVGDWRRVTFEPFLRLISNKAP